MVIVGRSQKHHKKELELKTKSAVKRSRGDA